MRRRILVLSVLLLAAFAAGAAPVSRDRASGVARCFFNDGNFRQVELLDAVQTKSGMQPSFYIFNHQGGGFVIVAGDDVCTPVLGYSHTGEFVTKGMPDNIKAWLEDIDDQVMYARNSGFKPSLASIREWQEASVVTKASSGDSYAPEHKIETALWKQREPFNDKAPTVDGKKAVAGCVSIALSIAMRYYGYPESGKGNLPSYSYTTDAGTNRTQQGHTLGHKYNWSKMLMNYANGYSSEEAEAVSTLVYDVGVMSKSKYDSSTSATLRNALEAAVTYMGYDAAAVVLKRSYFTDDQWIEMLKAELQNCPVIYDAKHDDGGGHAFIFDGYDNRDFFSINWGWGGSDNGYFSVKVLNPSSVKPYTNGHNAIFGFKPNAGGVSQTVLYMLSATSSSSGETYCGLETSDEIVAGKDFTMKFAVSNTGLSAFSGQFALGLVDAEGNIREIISKIVEVDALSPGYWRGYTNVDCHMTLFPEEGDKVMLFYRDYDGDGIWHQVFYDSEKGVVGQIPVYDRQTLQEVTSFNYDIKSGKVSIRTKSNVKWSIVSESGKALSDEVEYEKVELIMDSSKIDKGTYDVNLEKGADKISFKLKMGSR